MAKMIVEENGFYSCNGKGCCGGTHFKSHNSVISSFNCEYCDSYKKYGLKIIDKREQKTLSNFFMS